MALSIYLYGSFDVISFKCSVFFLAVPIPKGFSFVLTGRQSGGRDHLRAQAVHLRHGHRAADGNQRRANTGKDLLVLNVRNEVFQ